MVDDDPLVQASPHLRSAIIGSSLLLLDLGAGSTSILTAGPALVWTSTTGPPRRPSDIALGIARDVGGSLSDHLGHVKRTVGTLLQQGLLVHAPTAGIPPMASATADAVRSARLTRIRATLAARSGITHQLASGAATTELVSDDAEDARFLGAALASMGAGTNPSPQHQIAAVRSRRSDLPFRLFVDGRIRHRAATRMELLRQVMYELNALARATGGQALALHAGAVELDGKVLLIAGESGSGKSTLTAALVQSGARYVTDEVAVVHLPSGAVAPFPKPIDLSPASWALLGIEPPRQSIGDDHLQKVPLPVVSIGSTSIGGTASAILELGPGASNPNPIHDPEARAITVLRHAFREPFEQPAGGELLQRLADWSTTTPMVRLGRGDLPTALDVARALLGCRPPDTGETPPAG